MKNIHFKTTNGISRRVTGFVLAVLLLGLLPAVDAGTLKSVEANALSGDSLEVRLKFDGEFPKLRVMALKSLRE